VMHIERSEELARKAFSLTLDVASIQGGSACELQLQSGLQVLPLEH
jgi:hypothetical protein